MCHYSPIHAKLFITALFVLKMLYLTTIRIFSGSLFTRRYFQWIVFSRWSHEVYFCCFPELLLVDATYKLNNLRMPLYLMMCVDGNGNSEIISLFLTFYETEDAITHNYGKDLQEGLPTVVINKSYD